MRGGIPPQVLTRPPPFPYFFVGTFIEGRRVMRAPPPHRPFPYFFVGTFIEGGNIHIGANFTLCISLLFRRDFH